MKRKKLSIAAGIVVGLVGIGLAIWGASKKEIDILLILLGIALALFSVLELISVYRAKKQETNVKEKDGEYDWPYD
jgi:F0F1-type ATP synthase assembly protein I